MAAGSMLRLVAGCSALNIHATPWLLFQRSVSNKNILEKLGLPEKPKRPVTPFVAFRMKILEDLSKKNPNYTTLELSKIAGQLWKKCSEEEKNKYKQDFQTKYEKYKNDMVKYEQSLTSQQKAEIKEAELDIKTIKEQKLIKLVKVKREKEFKKPKHPLPIFFKFISSIQKPDDEARKDFVKRMAEKWAKLPKDVKEKYEKEFEKERQEYLLELEKWEEEMIRLGNVDMVRTTTLKNKIRMYS